MKTKVPGPTLLFLFTCQFAMFAFAEAPDPLTFSDAAHPRLLFSSSEQTDIETLAKTDKLLARLIEQNRVNAVAMLEQPRIRYEIPDGKRLLTQSRRCIERVVAMAMAYRLSGEKRFAEGAIAEMLVAADFKDWNPSHFLDTAEMTAALAIGYDWLYDMIDSAKRDKIRAAIVKHGLDAGLKVYKSGRSWTVGDNNWNQVCNGGMTLGALAIAEDEPELAGVIIAYALKSIPHGTKVYAPSGAYPEGPSYWQYGTAYTLLTIKALQTALGSDFDIGKTPGLERTGWYRMHTIGPTGRYFNYADGGTGMRAASTMFALSRLYDQPVIALWHRKQLTTQLSPYTPPRPLAQDRFFPLEIAWYDPRGESVENVPCDALFESRQDIVTIRSAWDDPNAFYLGFKGGDNRTNHGHLDIGSFVLEAEGERWALDLGKDNYNMPGYFGRERWQYYRMTNRSHNTLVIGDRIQNPSSQCKVIKFHSSPDRVVAVVDMTEAYKDQAKSVFRGVEMIDRRAFHVRDEITNADGEIRWGMITAAAVELDGSHALLRQGGKTLKAEILAPPDAKFEIASTRPPTAQEEQNQGTRMLAINVGGRPNATVTISVLMQPLNEHQAPSKFAPKPINAW